MNTSDWDQDFKQRHPFSYWIDNTLFKRVDGICGFAVHHFLSHPWIIFFWSYQRILWAWQRVFRGWDDRVIWSVDWYLAEMIPVWVRELKDKGIGMPVCMFDESDWDNEKCEYIDGAYEKAKIKTDLMLEKIAEGFEQYEKLHYKSPKDEDYEEIDKIFQEGFDLFREHFGTLWW